MKKAYFCQDKGDGRDSSYPIIQIPFIPSILANQSPLFIEAHLAQGATSYWRSLVSAMLKLQCLVAAGGNRKLPGFSLNSPSQPAGLA